ncbi:MAG: alpha/beta family hydrolase [Steroidobacteraceae bacterium]
MAAGSKRLTIDVNDTTQVSGLLEFAKGSKICLVLAHGAGAGMEHPSMAAIAQDLAARDIATLRYQFPYMERGEKRTDAPPLCHATVRAAVAAAAQLIPEVPLIAGGKSFGGRMTSQAQAVNPLPGVRGLAFFGFPLHPPDKPSIDRAAHLSKVKIPMLFLQGTRDTLADLALLIPLVDKLENLAILKVLEGADHSFHVLKRSGRTDEEVKAEMIDAFSAWAEKLPPPLPGARLGNSANGG